MFSFFYITTTYLAWNGPTNGQNETEMGGARDVTRLEPPGMFFCITFNCFFKTTNPFFTD